MDYVYIKLKRNTMNYSNPFEAIDARLNDIERLLIDIKHRPEGVDADGDFLTVTQAANFLSVSVGTVYNMIYRNELPVMKRSKRCYFSRKELIDYLKSGRKKTASELADEAISMIGIKKGGAV